VSEYHRYRHRHALTDVVHRHDATPKVTIDGIVVSQKTVPQIRERVGIVFSDPDDQLIGLTVREEVAFGPRARRWPDAEVAAVVSEALGAVGLAGFEHRSPHHLSAGEKRRACLAGVLACRPGLLLLDSRPQARPAWAPRAGGCSGPWRDPDRRIARSRIRGRLCSRAVIDRGTVVVRRSSPTGPY
jgi:hypothetical protein